jgi:hypothetical protein
LVIVDADFGDCKILAPINEAQVGSFKSDWKDTVEIAAIEKVSIARQ